MIHGDVVTMTSEGILVHDKALQPLGIFDQSFCWAVWAASPYGDARTGVTRKDYPNLIISPIHPSSWPFLLRLEITIRDEEGALTWLCEKLNNMGLSILFLECSTAGFSHAFCHIIAESVHEYRKDAPAGENTESVKKGKKGKKGNEFEELRSEKSQFDLEHPWVRLPSGNSDDFNEAQKIADKISAKMFAHAKHIEQDLNDLARLPRVDSPPGDRGATEKHYLHSWEKMRDAGKFLFNEKNVIEKMVHDEPSVEPKKAEKKFKQYIENQSPRSAVVHYMQRLAYFSLYGGGLDVPFALRYDANSSLLKLTRNEVFAEEGIQIYNDKTKPFQLGTLPRSAICIYDSQDKYLRLKPVTTEILKHTLTQITVEYRVVCPPSKSAAMGSVGLLRRIGEELQSIDVNLLHVANKSTRYEYAVKAGIISYLADVPVGKYPAVQEAIKSINFNKPRELEDLTVEEVHVNPFPHRRLFVSMHFGNPREADIKKLIKSAARLRGFEDVIVFTSVAPATLTIMDQISSCHAFLQLLLFRAEDDPKHASFTWLDFEYGVAHGKGIPSVRLVDVVRQPYDWWTNRITTNPDQRVKVFRSDASETDLMKVITEAIEELAQELLKRQHDMA